MPSLDLLQENKELNNLKIFPINVGKDNLNKASSFFNNLKIRNKLKSWRSAQTKSVKKKPK